MLEDTIRGIRNRILTGELPNEASVSQGVVLPLLYQLGWDVFDTNVVSPEYGLEGRRVDFALCTRAKSPAAFIEVKLAGREDGGDRQLFENAFHQGVPLAVLTNGREWHFFLPSGQGEYQERRVYKLDLIERDPGDCAQRFNRYLLFDRVRDGSARTAFEEDYRNNRQRLDSKRAIPDAWTRLLAEQDELLMELLSDKVEDLSGYKPEPDDVAEFLKARIRTFAELPVSAPTAIRTTPTRQPAANAAHGVRLGFLWGGSFIAANSAKDAMIKVLQYLEDSSPGFLRRFAAHPRHGRSRRFVDQDPNRLYRNRPDLVEACSFELKPGWWVGTNYSKDQIRRIIELACQVAGVQVAELRLNLGD